MNLRTKIVKLEASIPSVGDIARAAEREQTAALMRRLGQLLTKEELEDLSGRAHEACEAIDRLGKDYVPTDEFDPRVLIARAEERWRREGRELPEYAWVDREAWGVR